MSAFNIEVAGGSSVRLPTAGKYCDRDIVITATGSASGSGVVYGKSETIVGVPVGGKTLAVTEGLIQVAFEGIWSTNEDKYDYWLEERNCSVIIDVTKPATYTITAEAGKYTVSTDTDSTTTAKISIVVSPHPAGNVTVKPGSSQYTADITWRTVSFGVNEQTTNTTSALDEAILDEMLLE